MIIGRTLFWNLWRLKGYKVGNITSPSFHLLGLNFTCSAMAEHPAGISLPDGLRASLPTVNVGNPVPSVRFNQFQAADLLGRKIGQS